MLSHLEFVKIIISDITSVTENKGQYLPKLMLLFLFQGMTTVTFYVTDGVMSVTGRKKVWTLIIRKYLVIQVSKSLVHSLLKIVQL